VSDSPRDEAERELLLGPTRTARGIGTPLGRRSRLETTQVDTEAASPRAVRAGELGAGARLKHYEIIRELGRGGMARVMVARDLKLGRKVALKFLDTISRDLTTRFLVEARATARCSHENIVVIYEVDEHEGRPFMALELLDGQSLASMLAETGPLPPRRAVEVMIPVVSALVHAHSLDIVHRDLKPENIFVSARGVIKVLDFGIAKVFAQADPPALPFAEGTLSLASTSPLVSGYVGTLPYMAPEQWGTDAIDHRADIWAAGIILWQLLTGRHPVEPITREKLVMVAAAVDEPLPSIATALPSLPSELERIVDRCLAKRKRDRHSSARELLDALLRLTPSPRRRLAEGDSPFLGLRPFKESDADRFFGRARDVTHLVERIRDQPLVGVVGPSGVGKSSFVMAGVVPALRDLGEDWEVLVVRPGRDPLASLAALLEYTSSPGSKRPPGDPRLLQRLRDEPGCLGAALRERAHQKGERVLLFVDQFEELYTLVGDAGLRQAFTACLAGVADDWSSPLRVVVSMRSDLVDRASEDRAFIDQLAHGLVFLPPPDRDGLIEALVQPLDAVGFRFEDPAIADEIADSLLATAGALPLLQFAAAKLWDARDRDRRLITRASYEAIGGIAGALAGHADQVLAGMAPKRQRIAREVFQRLVTADGTRLIAQIGELVDLSDQPREVESTIDLLVAARLLVMQSRGEAGERAVEIVHESLIQSWPTLRRWLDERHEDSAFLEHLRAAARQWDANARPRWLLWTGDSSDEARRFARRYKGELGPLEQEYLAAVIERGTRVARRRRGLLIGAFAVLLALVAASAVALVKIRDAERAALEQESVARAEAERARSAEHKVSEQLVELRAEEEARQKAEHARESAVNDATAARSEVELSREQLAEANSLLKDALQRARIENARSAELARAERAAKEKNAALLQRERERVKQLEEQKRKISTELK
jgi:serine/threonine protein kinase